MTTPCCSDRCLCKSRTPDESIPLIPVSSATMAALSLPRVHELKTWPGFFAQVKAGDKRFEVRINDRNFKGGDLVTLREWDPTTNPASSQSAYTGDSLTFRIGYLLPLHMFAGAERLVVFSLEAV